MNASRTWHNPDLTPHGKDGMSLKQFIVFKYQLQYPAEHNNRQHNTTKCI